MHFLIDHPLLTIMLVLSADALLGQTRLGPLRFGAAGALFTGLVVGAFDPRLGQGLDRVKVLPIQIVAG